MLWTYESGTLLILEAPWARNGGKILIQQALDTATPASLQTTEADSGSSEALKVKGADLLNLLNYVNFQEGTVFTTFRHPAKNEPVSFQAFPLPSLGGTLVCRWVSPMGSAALLRTLVFESLLMSDGQNFVVVKATVVELDKEKIVLKIPEYGYEKSSRTVRRQRAVGVRVQVFQHGLSFLGTMGDFNAVSFQVDLVAGAASFHGLNLGEPVTAVFENASRLLYSGECRITRSSVAGNHGSFVLMPNFNNLRRFRPKAFRSLRHVLSPVPLASFTHPLTGRSISLPVNDLSGAGLSVEEFFENSVLLPGLILPDLVLEIGNQFLLKCTAQVLYRNVFTLEGAKNKVRCGVVFLDLDLRQQARLATLLHQTLDHRIRVCAPVDMEELWRFFFESGFLYPSKYVALEASKREFKKTYEKIYLESPEISRHFLFQDKGVLFAHMSMIRAYPNSWLIHHHAASKSGYGLAGVAVLDHATQYINEFHSHEATHMDYVMCYYRRENKFPHRVFGGAFQDVNDPKGVSVDAFAYFFLDQEAAIEGAPPYQVFPVSADDLRELKSFYESVSGGLLLEAMNLTLPVTSDNELETHYARQGFRRKHEVFSLKQQGALKAVITLQLSELGVNLSNLTHCLHVVVVDSSLDPKALFSGLENLKSHYNGEELPILVFPQKYLDDHRILYEKSYLCWVLKMTHLDAFFESLQSRFKRVFNGKARNEDH